MYNLNNNTALKCILDSKRGNIWIVFTSLSVFADVYYLENDIFVLVLLFAKTLKKNFKN